MKLTTRDLTFAALIAALTFVGSYIAIPLGPVPVTLQSFFVSLSAVVLTPVAGALAMIIHLLLIVLIRGGQSFVSPSFGFVIGFIIAVYIASLFRQKYKNTLWTVIIAAIIPYIIGIPYMGFILNGIGGASLSIWGILMAGLIPFIPGDIIKTIGAYFVGKALNKRFK